LYPRDPREQAADLVPLQAQTSGAIVRVDEDDRDAKESEVARDRQGWMAVYLHRSCLQPVSIAKPDGQNMKRDFDFGLASNSSNLKRHF